MDERCACIVRVAASVGTRDPVAVAGALDDAAALAKAVGSDIVEAVDEVLLQSILFVGYPAGLDALAAWRQRTAVSVAAATDENPSVWEERGARVCASVYGAQYEPLRANIRALHPDAERLMISHGYGRILGRAGLDLVTRELAVVAQLAVLGATRQLYSHARGALRVGAPLAAVERAFDIARPWIPENAKASVDSIWTEVLARIDTTPSHTLQTS